jgi:hypothetical protein
MTAQLRCAGCNHRFGKRSRSVVLVAAYALCAACSANVGVHRRLFFGCGERHTPVEHVVASAGGRDGAFAVATRGRAREIINA